MYVHIRDDISGVVLSQEDGEDSSNYKLHIPKGYRYLGEVLSHLPKGCFINKTTTGSGGSTLAILEEGFTVIAVPRLLLVHNKRQQHSHLFDVHGAVKQSSLMESVERGQKKYICTYDSLGRLVEALGENVSKYDLLVDEAHVLIREAGEFRASVSDAEATWLGVCVLSRRAG